MQITNPSKIAICLYGTDRTYLDQARRSFSTTFGDITFFEEIDETDIYWSLFKSCYSKRQFELAARYEFDVCLALNVSGNSDLAQFLKSDHLINILISPHKLIITDEETLYFAAGHFKNHGVSVTVISLDAFFASSIIFDLACNFGVAHDCLPKGRPTNSPGEDFYYFLKTLKIKTECINYENSYLFKRTA